MSYEDCKKHSEDLIQKIEEAHKRAGSNDLIFKERTPMIQINKSETADTRSCDFTKVTEKKLRDSSVSHILDVCIGLKFFQKMLLEAGRNHDHDKISGLEQFHKDFVSGFKSHEWWDNHRKINRHHLTKEDGIPEDVNLIDILEYITDCTMAGMARTGEVYDLGLPDELLQRAFKNTCELLKDNVEVVE